MKQGSSTHVDPTLYLYVEAYLQCVIDNKSLNECVPRGNGTLCRLVSLKMRDHPSTHKWEALCEMKVWWVCETDIKWIDVELVPKP